MGRKNPNAIDDTTLEFPRVGFWLVHTIGAAAVFLWGIRSARRVPLSVATLLSILRRLR